MFCNNLNRVDLVVWFGNDKPLFVETVTFDDKFWKIALNKIDFFYRRAVMPEIITRRVQRGGKLYLHGGWKNFDQ